MTFSIDNFIRWEVRSRDSIDVKRCYIDVAGELVTGVLLSQIIYWHLPDSEGKSKLKIQHDDYYWIAKKREDWWDEVRISPKQFDRCLASLEEKGLVETKLYRFQGSPTKHIRLKWDVLLQALDDLPDMVFPQRSISNLPSESYTSHTGENGYSPKVEIDIPQRSKSNLPKGENVYIDPETTPENTNKEQENPPIIPHAIAVVVEEERGGVLDVFQTVPEEITFQRKPNGSEWFPWEKTHPVKGWIVEEGFFEYEKELAMHTTYFKNIPENQFEQKLEDYIDKAHHLLERRTKLIKDWQRYQDILNGVSVIYSNRPSGEAYKQATQQSRLEDIIKASKGEI